MELQNSVIHQLVSTSQESPTVSEKVVVLVVVVDVIVGSTLSPATKEASVTNAMMKEGNAGTDLKHQKWLETDPAHDASSFLSPVTEEKTPMTFQSKKR